MSGYPDDWDTRRRQVYQRDRYKCANCRDEGGPYGDSEVHAHHVVPKSEGGSDRLSNLITLCADCHARVHTGNTEMQQCLEPRDQPLEVVDDAVEPEHRTMFSLVEYEDGEIEKTEKAIRIGETKYLVVTTTHGRLENYIVDCDELVCDCPNFKKIQRDGEDALCGHFKAVISQGAESARDMILGQIEDNPTFRTFDPDVH